MWKRVINVKVWKDWTLWRTKYKISGRNCICKLFPTFLRRLKGIAKKWIATWLCVCVGGGKPHCWNTIQNRLIMGLFCFVCLFILVFCQGLVMHSGWPQTFISGTQRLQYATSHPPQRLRLWAQLQRNQKEMLWFIFPWFLTVHLTSKNKY